MADENACAASSEGQGVAVHPAEAQPPVRPYACRRTLVPGAPFGSVDAEVTRLRWTLGGLLLLLAGLALVRPPLPVDETRYLSVAWEMYAGGDWLVPHLNGQPYAHKPPLFFWLVAAGWEWLGPVVWWPRVITVLAAAATLVATRRLARRLWPKEPAVAALAPLILVGTLGFAMQVGTILFDLLATACAVFAVERLVAIRDAAAASAPERHRLLRDPRLGLALAVSAGLLAKGPIALLPSALVLAGTRWWTGERGPRREVAGRGLAGLLAGLGLAACWALPAGLRGGAEYAGELLLGQTGGRLVASFAHAHPWWWYAPVALAVALPYSLWWRPWSALRLAWQEPGARLCGWWAAAGLVLLSAISGKQPHYLLALLPAAALLVARGVTLEAKRPSLPTAAPWGPRLATLGLAAALGLGPWWLAGRVPADLALAAPRWWAAGGALAAVALALGHRRMPVGLALLSPALLAAVVMAGRPIAATAYDLGDVAGRVAALVENEGAHVAVLDDYHGELGYLAQLEQPVETLRPAEAQQWLEHRPDGLLLAFGARQLPPGLGAPAYQQPYRGRSLLLWLGRDLAGPPPPAATVVAHGRDLPAASAPLPARPRSPLDVQSPRIEEAADGQDGDGAESRGALPGRSRQEVSTEPGGSRRHRGAAAAAGRQEAAP
jgi:4-amino-4-deoxy-L-arabinose transferase-like glycosyltransferase